jgi:hypothetical protein
MCCHVESVVVQQYPMFGTVQARVVERLAPLRTDPLEDREHPVLVVGR